MRDLVLHIQPTLTRFVGVQPSEVWRMCPREIANYWSYAQEVVRGLAERRGS